MRPFSLTLLVVLFLLVPAFVKAQTKGLDTAYIKDTPEKMILRAYFSRKYTEINYGDQIGVYEPNTGLNLGVGVTFQKFTLNIGVPVSFLNPDRKEEWPSFLDLQSHIYPNSWIIDLFGQFYNGYYIKDFNNPGEDYLRKDIRVVKLGASASYLFNGEKLSFEAAFHQSAIQKRSAFSPMVGFEAYRVRISGDSLILPESDGPILGNYSRGDFWQVGPNAGFAGTLVIGKGFFITGAASGNLGLGISKADQDKETKNVELMPGYFLRGFAGYNGDRISINVSYVYKQLDLTKQQDISHSVNTGNYRLNLIYKINPGPKLTKTYTKFNPLQIISRMKD
ncbi:DUF4421 domain-containing protein [Algoriphagus sp. A40]|uniref:DUF4421 domain-containing protein n=1 Tax=Algoriphagus sp. A40 TaxID=1945863 RepID=UPI0009C53954|nr:DUF4421 domain-containing protein [Algoriphagus sp. A40]OOG78699.1 hypothetical protein B0E43_00640 [Algoriphagus sp. A40]